jgi:hypothetical protein
VSDFEAEARAAADQAIKTADALIDSALEASTLIFRKYPNEALGGQERVATIAKFLFTTVPALSPDVDFPYVIAARAVDRLMAPDGAGK